MGGHFFKRSFVHDGQIAAILIGKPSTWKISRTKPNKKLALKDLKVLVSRMATAFVAPRSLYASGLKPKWPKYSKKCLRIYSSFSEDKGSSFQKGLGDLAVLAHLQAMGCGNLKTPPREVHFSGCINESYAFNCTGGDFFVKINRKFTAAEMFEGEAEVLRQIKATETLHVPTPLAVGNLPEGQGSYIIMEYLNFRPFGMMQSGSQKILGQNLARMHLATGSNRLKFGFDLPTKLGIISLDNSWSNGWSTFFIEKRLKDRLEKVFSKLGDDADELKAMSEKVLVRAVDWLDDQEIRPSILHGDLWVGNTGLTQEGQITVFDPAGFVGHSEFDLAFEGWTPTADFPGFSNDFYASYFDIIPKSPGYWERHQIYQLFHLLNHLLIYGKEYFFHTRKTMELII